jgi:hypothetical protein
MRQGGVTSMSIVIQADDTIILGYADAAGDSLLSHRWCRADRSGGFPYVPTGLTHSAGC